MFSTQNVGLPTKIIFFDDTQTLIRSETAVNLMINENIKTTSLNLPFIIN